jgi:hypothetical protein
MWNHLLGWLLDLDDASMGRMLVCECLAALLIILAASLSMVRRRSMIRYLENLHSLPDPRNE